MTIEELLCEAYQKVHKDQAKLILATLLNQNPLELTMHLDLKVNEEIINKYQECLDNIINGLPLQYALKETNFMGLNFYVDNRVLIPRFETEELVYNTNKYIQKYFNSNIKILDIGTGSGCCGLTLKKLNNNFQVTLLDISQDAIDVAKINSQRLNLDVNYLLSDIFSNVKEKYDVIISNPPYVSIDDEIEDIVINNEPNIALYANNNGLEYYEKILKDCEKYLNSTYLIAFEIGNKQKENVVNLINKYLKDVKIIAKQDMSSRDRMIFIFKNVLLNE